MVPKGASKEAKPAVVEAKTVEKKEGQPTAPAAKKHQDVQPKGKTHEALPGMCSCWTCKSKADRFNFCAEHYEQFKFGLIKKSGEMVSDYEKKFEHYTAYVAAQKRSVLKAA